ncbi:MAG: hypothetical protein RSA57_03915 [Cetobacterium sp.]|uniref:hypothetical protein n=1 Tax=Bacteria TaxID=2 RepID=UPI002FC5E34B
MTANNFMNRYKIMKLNRKQLDMIDSYNKRQNNILKAEVIFILLASLIKNTLIGITFLIIVTGLISVSIYLRIRLKSRISDAATYKSYK